MSKRMRLSRPSYQWGLVLAGVIVVYVLINEALPHLFTGWSRVYVARPILWCLLIAGVVLAARYGTGGKLWFTRSLLWIGLLMGAFQVSCMVIAAVLTKFGDSPYAHTPYAVFTNTVFFGTALVGIEFSRAYLLSAFTKRNTMLMVVLVALLFTGVGIPVTKFTSLGNASVLPFYGGTVLPLFAANVLAGFLVLTGGPVAAIAYWGFLEGFEWFSPILPQLSWIVKAFVGILAPVVCLLVLQSLYGEEEEKPEPEKAKAQGRKRFGLVGWVVTAIVVLAIVWVSFGALGFRPVAILSGSMSPHIDVGDLVVIKDVSVDSIERGDVIEYTRNNTSTIHRVIDIVSEDGSLAFITQGDANPDPDAIPVRPEQIKGRVSLVFPKIGWVSIKLKQLFT